MARLVVKYHYSRNLLKGGLDLMFINGRHVFEKIFFCVFLIGHLLLLFMAAPSFALSFPGDSKVSHRAVSEHLSQGSPEDLIIILNEEPAAATAVKLREKSGATHDTQHIVRAKASMHRAMKAGVFSGVSPQEVETLRDYSHLPVMFVKVKSLEGLKRLAAHADIKGIYRNRAFGYFLAESLPLIGQPKAAINGYTGAGASVAVLDTGVDYTDPAFGSCSVQAPGDCDSLPPAPAGCRIACVHDFASDDDAPDDDGHGTTLSGIVAGVAPDAHIVSLDIFEQDGYAYSSTIISAINWVIANRAAYNIVAMNMSFGGDLFSEPCVSDELAVPISEARSAGILSAIASGNERRKNAIASPACVPAAVSVGAVYDADLGPINWGICRDASTAPDKIVCFSNSAHFLTLLGTGSEISAAGWIMSGTSLAAPHVAGAIAVLRGDKAFPSETVDQTVSRLIVTGVPIKDARNGITRPRLNLNAATGDLPVIAPTFAISGYVKTAANTALPGVKVSLSGVVARSVSTAPDGSYYFSNLPEGAYVVAPSQSGYVFLASPRQVSISSADVMGVNFTRGLNISGTVKTTALRPIKGVKVTLAGLSTAETLTDSTGRYRFMGLTAGSYTVTPSKLSFAFTPAAVNLTLGSSDALTVNFRARTFAIYGTIKKSSGSGMRGVAVTVTGCDILRSVTSGSTGTYSVTDLPNCSDYRVTPALAGYAFTPVSRTIAVNNANVFKADFTSP